MWTQRLLWLLERPWVIWLLLLPVAVAYTQSECWDYGADHWETTAAMRAIAENPTHPCNPMLALPGDTSPRFTPYTVVWGMLMKWFGLHVLLLMKLTAYANGILFVTGINRLLSKLFNLKTLSSVMLLCMLLIWGRGYAFANSYEWWQFFYSLPHVAVFAYGAGFHALASLADFIQTRRLQALACYAGVSWIVFVSHPITGLFIYAAAIALLLVSPKWREAILLQAIPVLAFLISFTWPYFDYSRVFFQGSTVQWYESILFKGQLAALGPILAGIPILLYYTRERKHRFAFYGATICTAVYLLSWAANISMGERFIFFIAFFLHLGIALFVSEWLESRREKSHKAAKHRWLRPMAIALIFLLSVPFLKHDVRMTGSLLASTFVNRPHAETVSEKLQFLTEYLSSKNVVLTDSLNGFSLPAITGAKTVYHMHGNPLLVTELETRQKDTEAFLKGDLSDDEQERVLKRYGVTHVLLDLKNPALSSLDLRDFLNRNGAKVAEHGMLVLYNVHKQSP